DFSVQIPENISPATVQKLPFTCRKYLEIEYEMFGCKLRPLDQETHPDSLKVTAEQIHNLTIKAGIREASSPPPSVTDSFSSVTEKKCILRNSVAHEKCILMSEREITLERPEELEIGQIYTLVVTSDNFAFSACLQKEVKADAKGENTTPHKEE